jgi:hypothetical protein
MRNQQKDLPLQSVDGTIGTSMCTKREACLSRHIPSLPISPSLSLSPCHAPDRPLPTVPLHPHAHHLSASLCRQSSLTTRPSRLPLIALASHRACLSRLPLALASPHAARPIVTLYLQHHIHIYQSIIWPASAPSLGQHQFCFAESPSIIQQSTDPKPCASPSKP